MITILFFIFVGLVVFHFIYDGILAPSLRFEIRIKLFKLRDRLRRLKIENDSLISDELFEYLQDDINKQLRLMPLYNIVNVFEAIRFTKDNEDIEKRIREIEAMVENCKVEEIKTIYEEIILQFVRSIVANAGGWVIYFLPFILLFLAGFIAGQKIRHFAAKILSSPDDTLTIQEV